MAEIHESLYGVYNGKTVSEYILTNSHGVQIGIINYGGIITKIITPDKKGQLEDIVTGFNSFEGYLQKGVPYFGALIGRYANRIGNATFTLDGDRYELEANNGKNSLHGGIIGFDKVYWEIKVLRDENGLLLTYLSQDGEEGFPGNVTLSVKYILTEYNELIIDYKAITDQATPINLTHHAYFNLSAGSESTILDHELSIKSDYYTPVDQDMIPTGTIRSVHDTPLDFNTTKKIGRDISEMGDGYDHNYVLSKNSNLLEQVAVLTHPRSGRKMEVYTTQPGMQLYTGNFIDENLKDTKPNGPYKKHGAICLETQHFPDSPNQPNFPNTILRPDDMYRETTIYKFGIL